MKLIVGLGNPGSIYENTRHNLGARIVKAIAKKYKVKLRLNRSLKSRCAKIDISAVECSLAIPQTFMNLSGEALALLFSVGNIALKDSLIIYDDMDLELGAMRFRKKGSSGGHKGIDSIIKTLNSHEFARLKLGIGRVFPKLPASNYVLSGFSRKETVVVNSLIKKAVGACEIWARFGIERAMNEYNRMKP